MIKLLLITTLYPNALQPRHGIFVETRLKQLLATEKLQAEVIAPVPWFPFRSEKFGSYAKYAKILKKENRNGLTIHHPRYLVIPRIGMILTPFFLAISILFCLVTLKKKGLRYDIVDAHYYYPDGVAVALLKKFLKKPIAITARGSDINLIPSYRIPKKLILWAAKQATATITVSQALMEKLCQLGADERKIHTLKNGVDLNFFKPLDREACKIKWGVEKPTLISVGNLVESKGHHLVVKALGKLPDYQLLIVGDGEYKKQLQELVTSKKLTDRVSFLGTLSQEELVEVYNASDLLVLASSREGMPNVLLESIACGTPVISTRVGGAAEVVQNESAGLLLEDRDEGSIVKAVNLMILNPPREIDVRASASSWSWNTTINGLLNLYGSMLK